MRPLETKIRATLYLSLILITLSVTPFWNIDPINLPKFTVLCSTSISMLPMLLATRVSKSRIYLLTVTVTILFIAWMFISFLVSEIPKSEQIFGTFGRNSGLLTYLCLFIFLIAAVKVSRVDFASAILHILSLCGLVNAFLCFLQWQNIGSEFWYNGEGQVIGTFGNQNFVSSFLAISICATFALIMKYESKKYKLALISLVLVQSCAVYLSKSSQGFYLVALTIFVFLGLKILELQWIHIFRIYICSATILCITITSGILGHEPLGTLLRQQTTEIRGDYWRAGWNMTRDNLLFGVGMDGFGVYFREFRDIKAASRDGASFSNSAHNIFLDLTSGGGIALGIFFLTLISITIYCAINLVANRTVPLYVSFGLIGCWLAWLIQSMISINQIALGTWGWMLTGTIIGVHLNQNAHYDATKSPEKRYKSRKLLRIEISIAIVLGGVLSCIPISFDYKFRLALEQSAIERILMLSESDLASGYYMSLAAYFFEQTGQAEKEEKTNLIAINRNIRDFEAWLRLLDDRKNNKDELNRIQAYLSQLDPHFKG